MLNLATDTPPDWAPRMLAHIDEILLDHAHCEKKAASTAISLIFRYQDQPALAVPLSRLAREELAHFEQVLAIMRERGLELRRQHPSPYAARLMEAIRPHEPARMLDTLLCCALIEARSCERMQRLAEALHQDPGADPALERLYRGLLASEARHHASYVELARSCDLAPETEIKARLAELAEHEAAVLRDAPDMPRLHC